MRIVDKSSGKTHKIEIAPVLADDYNSITTSRFWLNWKEESEFEVCKLKIMETRDRNKKFEHITGNLIAFACMRAITQFGEWACVSLVPKTQLIEHYTRNYSMIQAGRSLFTDGIELVELIRRYDHD